VSSPIAAVQARRGGGATGFETSGAAQAASKRTRLSATPRMLNHKRVIETGDMA
jgi:hypothetical protein